MVGSGADRVSDGVAPPAPLLCLEWSWTGYHWRFGSIEYGFLKQLGTARGSTGSQRWRSWVAADPLLDTRPWLRRWTVPAPVLPCLHFLRPCCSSRPDCRRPQIGKHVCWLAGSLRSRSTLAKSVKTSGLQVCPQRATRVWPREKVRVSSTSTAWPSCLAERLAPAAVSCSGKAATCSFLSHHQSLSSFDGHNTAVKVLVGRQQVFLGMSGAVPSALLPQIAVMYRENAA